MNSSHGEGCWTLAVVHSVSKCFVKPFSILNSKKSLLVACDAMVSFELEKKVCLTAVLLVDID
jgi:hypothetical protein